MKLALIVCFLASIVYEWFAPGWGFYYLSKLVIIAMLATCLFLALPYRDLSLKAVAFLVLIDSVWNIGQWFANGAWQGPLELLNAAIFLPWLLYAWYMRDKEVNDGLSENTLCIIGRKADSFSGFILSLFGGEYGKYAYYLGGTFYAFHRGEFKMLYSFPLDGCSVIDTGVPVTSKIIWHFNKKVGSKWSWFNNCVTVRYV